MRSERLAVTCSAALILGACATAPAAQRTARAECALPPGDSLVDVRALDRTIRIDIRYATPANFTSRRLPGYEARLALLRPDAARALARVQRALREQGLGLKVWDAYRPVRATLAMVEWAESTGNRWVLEQGYVARESGHNRGNTIDLTMVRLRTGRELDMGTPFDEFSAAAHTANAEGAVQENRHQLVAAMAREGFVNYDQEWWHFRRAGDERPLDAPLGCFR